LDHDSCEDFSVGGKDFFRRVLIADHMRRKQNRLKGLDASESFVDTGEVRTVSTSDAVHFMARIATRLGVHLLSSLGGSLAALFAVEELFDEIERPARVCRFVG
jgi:hypothetical protein